MLAFLVLTFLGVAPGAETIPDDFNGPWPWESELRYEWENGELVRRFEIGDIGRLTFPQMRDGFIEPLPSPPGGHLRTDRVFGKDEASFYVSGWRGQPERMPVQGEMAATGRLMGPWRLRRFECLIIRGIKTDRLVTGQVADDITGSCFKVSGTRYLDTTLESGPQLLLLERIDEAPYQALKAKRDEERRHNELRLLAKAKASTSLTIKLRSTAIPGARLDDYELILEYSGDTPIQTCTVQIVPSAKCENVGPKSLRIDSIQPGETKRKAFAWPRNCEPLAGDLDLILGTAEKPKVAVEPDLRCGPCAGRGWFKCSRCNGKGRIARTGYVHGQNGLDHPVVQRFRCGKCGGDGKASCKTCKGSGQTQE